jgi:UDP-N-acetylmuramoyl-L-alanyl-D-glutamate--2,6-diaminopimelate ligase
MTVSELFAGVSLRANLPPNLALLTVTGLEYDSRRVSPGNLFFAFEGQHADGRRFAADAIGRGAIAVVSQSPRPADFSGNRIELEHGLSLIHKTEPKRLLSIAFAVLWL